MEGNKVRSLLARNDALIMGILNVTPDSFSDGGRFNSQEAALAQARVLVDEGADIIDIGGESTRPKARKVTEQEELDRVIPVIERLAQQSDVAISIDTYKPQVMQEALSAGASMVNDVNGFRAEGALGLVASEHVPICIMHMQGQPESMQVSPYYQNVADEVAQFLIERANQCVEAGIELQDIVLDPGIGFGKTLKHNLQLLNSVKTLRESSGCEVLVGVSRKSLIDQLLDRTVEERLHASLGLAVQAVLNGVKIVRVHDVKASFDAIRAVEAVSREIK